MAQWRISLMACAVLIAGTAIAQTPDQRPRLRPLALAEQFNPTAAPLMAPRPKLRRFDTGRTASSIAVQKVVLEQTITEDVVAQKLTKAAIVTTGMDAGDGIGESVTVSVRQIVPDDLLDGLAVSPRPQARPEGFQLAMAKRKDRAKRYSLEGSVCGLRGIRGYSVKRVRGKGACGIAKPVKVSEIDGIKLTREALIGCDAARALYRWVHDSAKPTVGTKGGGLASIQLIASYSCRNRNSAKRGKLSEHAKGNAVDIAGFVLKNGTTMSVLRGWRSGEDGPTLKRLHKTACGPFRTVLGPKANRFHQDHFHFDVAQHRGGGAYCR
ncbi:extensin-like domain-containing protein [Neptunicoccus cionae]|uniref:extensin-like domain-containing protein n=1 Tax=Neptunicoccus cionae TaxID=2035344 RepID=UPI00257043FC|nr:extensin family protein [Amylibacter cionae]